MIRDTVQCDDILCELLADGIWHWTYEDPVQHVPILDDLMRHVNHCSLQRYTEKRDNLYRHAADQPPKWEGINPNLAFSCLATVPANTRQYIQVAGRVWHKSYKYGSNRIKGVTDPVEARILSKCLHCNQTENPSHIYAKCRLPALKRLRETIFDSQTQSLRRIQIDPNCPGWMRIFFTKLHRYSFSPHKDRAETCWNGTIGRSVMRRLLGDAALLSLPFAYFQQFRKQFTNFVTPLSYMATQMELAQQQARVRSAFSSVQRVARSLTSPPIRTSPRPPLHPAFRPTTPATPRQRPRTPLPPRRNSTRILTQTRFVMPEVGRSPTSSSMISLTTITHHEHLAITYSELNHSSSGRALCYTESTETPPPIGVLFHEAPD